MYNIIFEKEENLLIVEEDIIVGNNSESKITTVGLTNKRLLFLETPESINETLRIAQGVDYVKEKEVYFSFYLNQIEKINNDTIVLVDGKEFIINSNAILSECKILTNK